MLIKRAYYSISYITLQRSEGTSAKFHEEEIVSWYEEPEVDIPPILQRFKNNYILDYNEDGKLKLAHDTLAPVVTELFETSQAPAQIAHRILTNKLKSIDFSKHQLFLEKPELKFIEDGQKGMRKWTPEMEELIRISKKQLRLKENIRKAQNLIVRARESQKDPTMAYRYASYAWQADPSNSLIPDLLQETIFKFIYEYRKGVYGTTFYKDLGVYSDDVNYAAYSPDNSCIAIACDDATARVINIQGGVIDLEGGIMELKGHSRYLHSVHFSPDGEWILTASGDNTACIWNRKGELVHRIDGHSNDVRDIQVSKDKKYALTASEDYTVKLWKVADWSLVKTFEHTNDVRVARFSADGAYFLTASEDGMAKLITIDGKEDKKIKGHKVDLLYADISPKNKFLVTCGEEEVAKVWTFDGRLHSLLKGHKDDIRCVRFSPDGQFIVTASEDHTAKIWNLDGKLVCSLIGHSDDLTSACFSPDGRYVVTTSEDRSVRLWDLEGNEVRFSEPTVLSIPEGYLQYRNIIHPPFNELIDKINQLGIADLKDRNFLANSPKS